MAPIDSHRLRAAIASAGVLAVLVAPQVLAGSQADGPKITEVVYDRSNESLDRKTDVQVEGRRIESLTIKASFGGETATAGTVKDGSISGRPWVLAYHDRGRRKLLNLMEESIEATGAVTLKLIARNDAGTTREPARIVFSRCHMDPPIYPFTCVVEV